MPERPTEAHHRGLERLYRSAPTNRIYANLAIDVDEGRCAIAIDVSGDLHHAAGAMHGSHYFKLLDDTAFFAANSVVPDVFVLTAQFSVQLLRPVVAGRIRAEGTLTRPGRSLLFAESRLFGPDGRVIGTGQGTFARSELRLAELPGYASEP
ncbi:MAG: PaaI family thioesterase [Myxococcales bacterium]|nr:PaaI family thioesterase [Myxococcales bacterium]